MPVSVTMHVDAPPRLLWRAHPGVTARRLEAVAVRRGVPELPRHEHGGQEIGRPQDVQVALDESLTIIQQLLGAER